jgi:hypothetical protein
MDNAVQGGGPFAPTAARILSLVVALAGAAGCNDHPIKAVELEREQGGERQFAVSLDRDVDVLFVIDNSRSMAVEQATLARNFASFLAPLEEPGVDANYRVAITTTDNGSLSKWCSSPDGGNFRLTSCRSRPEEFVDENSGIDELQAGCLDVCAHDEIEILPTTTREDPQAKPRPWIERNAGRTNLPEGISPAEAFSCFGPQGVTGCGFESTLETMRRGLQQAGDAASTEYGFLRPNAILAVVIVTDEEDCSARYHDIPDPWDPDGSRALWSDLNATGSTPTSEVCWFGGVTCEDNGDGTKSCHAADIGADGDPVADPEDAVLFPLERYVDFLDGITASKQELHDNRQVLVAVIAGVPIGYAGGDLSYADGTDTEFRRQNGIGPGCVSEGGEAVPPVRLLEFAQATQADGENNLFSICQDDYSAALTQVADAIRRQVQPGCVPECVLDEDPLEPGLQHVCTIEQTSVDADGIEHSDVLLECEVDGEELVVPDGEDTCYVSKHDLDGATPSTVDDMVQDCRERGANLQITIAHRDPSAAPSGAQYLADCRLSLNRALDCPELD